MEVKRALDFVWLITYGLTVHSWVSQYKSSFIVENYNLVRKILLYQILQSKYILTELASLIFGAKECMSDHKTNIFGGALL